MLVDDGLCVDIAPKAETVKTLPVAGVEVEGEFKEEGEQEEDEAEDDVEAVRAFEDMSLHPDVLRQIVAIGWSVPTDVQALCLPQALAGEDVVGFAQTGTGKTGVFLIALAQKMVTARMAGAPDQAVILAPTRELVMQIFEECEKLLAPLGVRSVLVFGGIDYEKQTKALQKPWQVIVATPGRLKDFVQQKVVQFRHISVFVCDEVDRMFDIGFLDDVEFFLKKTPEQAQKLMFSATTSDSLQDLCLSYLKKPKLLWVSQDELAPENIEQKAILCSTPQKLRVFMGLLRDHKPKRAIIFTNTKITAEWLHHKLCHNGFETELITGDLPQRKRIALIQKIKEGKIRYLIATDVASRGLHISDLSHVYNFDLPTEASNYVHRIGRTARAGAAGLSYSLVCDEYGSHLEEINTLMQTPLACEWFPESYLQIEDLAPQMPRTSRTVSSSRSYRTSSERSEPSRSRGQGKSSPKRSGVSKARRGKEGVASQKKRVAGKRRGDYRQMSHAATVPTAPRENGPRRDQQRSRKKKPTEPQKRSEKVSQTSQQPQRSHGPAAKKGHVQLQSSPSLLKTIKRFFKKKKDNA